MTASFHLYLDSATRSDIEKVLPNPFVYGVTTNPTLMRRAALSRAALPDFVGAVLGLGARVVHVQVEEQGVTRRSSPSGSPEPKTSAR